MYQDPDATKDPWRVFMRSNEENRGGKGYIQGAFGVANRDGARDGNDFQSLTFKANFDLYESNFASDGDQAQMSKLAVGVLHPILFGKKAREEDTRDLLSAEKFIDKAFDDKSPGFNFLYALGRGRFLDCDEKQKIKGDEKSVDRANFLAVSVSYTHLTLSMERVVEISVVVGSRQKNETNVNMSCT